MQNQKNTQTKTTQTKLQIQAFQAKKGFKINLACYAIVNSVLVTINMITIPHYPWFLYPLSIWGFGVTIHYVLGVHLLGKKVKAQNQMNWRPSSKNRLEASHTQSQKNERFFSIELNSKDQIKNISLTNGSQKATALIEGTIGSLTEVTFAEGLVLEVSGTKGIIRLDLQAKEINTNPLTGGG